MGIILIVLVILLIAILISCVKIVPQAKAMVVERLGAFQATWSVGIHFLVPFVDRIAYVVSMKRRRNH